MDHPHRFDGIRLPVPEFGDDDGAPAPELAAALQAYDGLDGAAVVAALVGARLLVPVVAVLDEAEPGDLTREKDSHMATVTLLGADGRRGLLAFTGTASLAAWSPDARPVAAGSARVAAAALQEGADAVLLDIAGPVRFAVEAAALPELAAGRAPLPAHRDPEVVAAVAAVVTTITGSIAGVRLCDGSPHGADLEVGLGSAPHRQAAAVATALAADEVLRSRCPRGIAVVTGPVRAR